LSDKNKRIGEKISLLRHEGVPQQEAIGEAEGMEKSGRLGRHGKYRRAKKHGRRKSGRK
jgi:hypothetical protein